ncbi:Notchless protein-like protein 1 [Harpegnathos saltator]|uniref:Notchless protein-like protein 1 n=1 Tax=Harpegnathos saltator TaxID=610380 RepID=E2BDB1_HARSA|nr:Notchless protein-like protein 1 [Harpegnathos saltator]
MSKRKFEDDATSADIEVKKAASVFKSDTGKLLPCGTLHLPINTPVNKLQEICSALLQQEDPLAFYVNNVEVTDTLEKYLKNDFDFHEDVVEIVYQQQALFKVRPITRCTGSIEGFQQFYIAPLELLKRHKEAVISVAFSPDGKHLASGSGDTTVRFWDIYTQTPYHTCEGHRHWVLCISWSPCGSKVASACHTKSVTCIKWGGSGLIYSASQDRTIKVWRAEDGVLCRTLEGHAHWVNTLALNVDYVLRTGPFNLESTRNSDPLIYAKNRYESIGEEILVSGSDDFTLFLWKPEKEKKSVARMTGHQQLINDVKFSPNGRVIASASFDKSIKLWESTTGKFIASLRGHVQAVYSIAWSADSRLLVSGSKDSTLKVWSMKTKKLERDLPGHADEVYAIDWSPDGLRVASGGKDKVLRLWQN